MRKRLAIALIARTFLAIVGRWFYNELIGRSVVAQYPMSTARVRESNSVELLPLPSLHDACSSPAGLAPAR
jgi:hypothetical protein